MTLSSSTLAELGAVLADGVGTRAVDRLGLAHDASHYLLEPAAVVRPRSTAEIAGLLAAAGRQGVALTFRSGGTSLSGQAVTDAVLVDTRRHFRAVEVLDAGARVRVQPGVTVGQVNARLAPYGRKLGPDPASSSACTVGGVVANNSSGMTCGTEFNSYATLDSATLVLPSGTVLDTGTPDADDRLRALEPGLHAGLAALRDRLRSSPQATVVRKQFAIKNTMGYGLNALLDHDRPSDILAHLVVGSEGTLAFLAEVVFRTVPVAPHAATGLLVFPDLHRATAALPDLVAAGPAAVELLDAAALRVAQADPVADAALRGLAVDRHAALLVELQGTDPDGLADRIRRLRPTLAGLPLSAPGVLSDDPAARAALWHIRKGLYATVAGARPAGTTALLEDVAVPVAALAATCAALTELFTEHGYGQSVIFGHAKDGNLHFMISPDFAAPGAVERYAAFTEDMVELVLGHDGTLKAEHGTGRVMAPFVRRQYGDELYGMMVELKRLCDPAGLLNPGVVITDDPRIHLRDLKSVPRVEEEVDRCVECGYCEPVCPSRDLTTTPRQRIVLRRELARAEADGRTELAAELRDQYGYAAVDTCAVDGMCATACPVLINTGDLVRRLRAEDSGRLSGRAATAAARHWDGVTRTLAAGLSTAAAVPPLATGGTAAARRVAGAVPRWSPDLPRGGARRTPDPDLDADAVFMPSCLGTLFAPTAGGAGAAAALRALAERAGVRLSVPDGIAGSCCGTPWSSKGLPGGYEAMRSSMVTRLLVATGGGALPVVVDAASCTEGYAGLLAAAAPRVRVLDAVEFTAEVLLPRLPEPRRLHSLALHPTCSSRRLGLDDALLQVARAVAEEVAVPLDWQCCAFAGDRGLLHPELTASATRAEAAEVAAGGHDAHASVNRTCEIGMTRATGRPYRHLLELLDEATRPGPPGLLPHRPEEPHPCT